MRASSAAYEFQGIGVQIGRHGRRSQLQWEIEVGNGYLLLVRGCFYTLEPLGHTICMPLVSIAAHAVLGHPLLAFDKIGNYVEDGPYKARAQAQGLGHVLQNNSCPLNAVGQVISACNPSQSERTTLYRPVTVPLAGLGQGIRFRLDT